MCTPLCTSFFFTDPPTTEIYTLSLHDALPIFHLGEGGFNPVKGALDLPTILNFIHHAPCHTMNFRVFLMRDMTTSTAKTRSEEHTSELQSRRDLVCRLMLEKKKKNRTNIKHS